MSFLFVSTLPIAFVGLLILMIWRFIDVILILLGKFKDEFGNTISYDGKFFESKSNIVITIMFIIQLVLLFIVLIFIFSLITLLISMGQM
jgi:hypothetical protein